MNIVNFLNQEFKSDFNNKEIENFFQIYWQKKEINERDF